jgi:hypothetical protein
MENIKIKISKEQADLFENTGNIVVVSDKDVYMNIPYWLKKTNEKYVFEYLTIDQLPVNIIKQQCYSEEDMLEFTKYLLSKKITKARSILDLEEYLPKEFQLLSAELIINGKELISEWLKQSKK